MDGPEREHEKEVRRPQPASPDPHRLLQQVAADPATPTATGSASATQVTALLSYQLALEIARHSPAIQASVWYIPEEQTTATLKKRLVRDGDWFVADGDAADKKLLHVTAVAVVKGVHKLRRFRFAITLSHDAAGRRRWKFADKVSAAH